MRDFCFEGCGFCWEDFYGCDGDGDCYCECAFDDGLLVISLPLDKEISCLYMNDDNRYKQTIITTNFITLSINKIQSKHQSHLFHQYPMQKNKNQFRVGNLQNQLSLLQFKLKSIIFQLSNIYLYNIGMNHQEQDFKTQRQKLAQSIRKENRENQFLKKRNLHYDQAQEPFGSYNPIQQQKGQTAKMTKLLVADQQRRHQIEQQLLLIINRFIKIKYFPQQFPQLVHLLQSDDLLQKHHGIIGIRKILSLNDSPPIHLVFEFGILPLVIDCMKQNIYPHLRLEATWIVSNISTGGSEEVEAIVQCNVVPLMVQFLVENKPGIADQAIWGIGNLAGDSPQIRDKVIDEGGVDAVIHFINNTTNQNNLAQAAWALSNLCRGNPLPNHQKVSQSLPILCKVLNLNILDDENLSDVLWAISYQIQGPKSRLNPFIESNSISQVINLAKSHQLSIASPALRILGTISTGNESQTEQLLLNGILSVFEQLLQSKKSLVRREVCWILSNIAAGTRSQVDQILDRGHLIDKILTLFELDSSEVKREICYVFGNMVFLGEKNRIKNLILSKDILRYYGDCIIQRNNYKLIETCLDTLPMLFDFGYKSKISPDEFNFAIYKFLNYPGVLQSFQQLQHLESQKIVEKSYNIYERYFDTENEKLDNNMAAEF